MQTLDKSIIESFKREKWKYFQNDKITAKEIKLLKKGVPFQKIIGFVEMGKIKINLDKKVLIPRYETEEVVLFSLEKIKKNNFNKVLDLCSGSGFIGLYLKKEIKTLNVTCSDISKNSINQINMNKKINNLEVNVIKSNLFKKINKKFDVIISNPPYISKKEYKGLDFSIKKYEPKKALLAKKNGLFFYKKIIDESSKYLNPGGILIFEINFCDEQFFLKKRFSVIKDINKKARIAYKFF